MEQYIKKSKQDNITEVNQWLNGYFRDNFDHFKKLNEDGTRSLVLRPELGPATCSKIRDFTDKLNHYEGMRILGFNDRSGDKNICGVQLYW